MCIYIYIYMCAPHIENSYIMGTHIENPCVLYTPHKESLRNGHPKYGTSGHEAPTPTYVEVPIT